MIKNIICRGIGFTPGSVKFIPTAGFSIGAEISPGKIQFEWVVSGQLDWSLVVNRLHWKSEA